MRLPEGQGSQVPTKSEMEPGRLPVSYARDNDCNAENYNPRNA